MPSTLAVVSQSGESLSFYDIASGEKTGHMSNLIAEPHELCYDDRTGLLYVTHAYAHGWYVAHGEDGKTISVIDCKQRKVVGTIDISPYGGPHYAVLDKSRDILYSSVEVGLEGAGGIIGIDLKTKKTVQTIPSGAKTHWLVMTPDGKKAYTCNKEAGFVSVMDLYQGQMIARIDLPGGCEQPGISNDGRYVYFPIPSPKASNHWDFSINDAESVVVVIDTATNKITTTIPLPCSGLTVHVDSLDRLLVGQFRLDRTQTPPKHLPGKLSIFSGPEKHFAHLATLGTDLAPLTVTSTSDGNRAFAANIFSGTVTMVDMEKLQVERTIEVNVEHRSDKSMHQGAHGMAIIP
ncbi:hypothetical protein CKM354_000797300 [Cercospora kikuchii]|uniref:Surface layer protein n=1 Tax=Cercospora kikuchii TaxID=84275 RepID=A0A9P3CS66_9PEZI|nr:uncharacterized protein CKM354_000797300 [Cercospora kikuchii]GIZ44785.1 hypothetical protein CKM354_000797300 [Cercospora kikuchii]